MAAQRFSQQAVLSLKEGAGYDAEVTLDPFIAAHARLTAQEDVPLFQARTAQRERGAGGHLDRFDGTAFAPLSDLQADLVPFQGDPP